MTKAVTVGTKERLQEVLIETYIEHLEHLSNLDKLDHKDRIVTELKNPARYFREMCVSVMKLYGDDFFVQILSGAKKRVKQK